MVCYLWFQFTNDQDVVWQTKMDLYKVARHSRKTKVLREWVQWRRGATWGAVLVAHGYIPLFVWCSVCSCCFVFCFFSKGLSHLYVFSFYGVARFLSVCVRAWKRTCPAIVSGSAKSTSHHLWLLLFWLPFWLFPFWLLLCWLLIRHLYFLAFFLACPTGLLHFSFQLILINCK